MLERSQVSKLRAVEKDLSLTALVAGSLHGLTKMTFLMTFMILQDSYMELTRVGSDSNNLRNKALITLTTYGYPRMQVCRLVKYCHPMHA